MVLSENNKLPLPGNRISNGILGFGSGESDLLGCSSGVRNESVRVVRDGRSSLAIDEKRSAKDPEEDREDREKNVP